MKHIAVLTLLAALLVAGCHYEAPLSAEDDIPIDSAVLGLWEPVTEAGETPEEGERMLILRYSDTEYMVHYPTGENALYYRCYPVKIDGVACVQLEIIGSRNGTPGDEKDLFHVASYRLADHELEIELLNTGLVDDSLTTTEALAEAFRKHRDNKELFAYPEKFTRVKQ